MNPVPASLAPACSATRAKCQLSITLAPTHPSQDIIKVRKGQGGSMLDVVSLHMTSPAIVVSMNASVQQAADLMLGSKIRRLPVVDAQGFPVG